MKARTELTENLRPVTKAEFRERLKAIKCFRYEVLPYFFVELLNGFEKEEFRITDAKLKADIQECIRVFGELVTIVKLPSHDGKAMPTRIVSLRKAYPVDLIERLNKILKHYPLYIQVEFVANTKLALRNKKEGPADDLSMPEIYKTILDKVRMRHKKALPQLRLTSYTNQICEGALSYPDDNEATRSLFANGLFDYVQGIVAGSKQKIMRCQNEKCNRWFLSLKQNHLTCDPEHCYEPFWRKACGGNAYRAKKMRERRKK